jgi:hypothetical protein
MSRDAHWLLRNNMQSQTAKRISRGEFPPLLKMAEDPPVFRQLNLFWQELELRYYC